MDTANVTELRVTLTVPDFDNAVSVYGDALGLPQLADWSSESGRDYRDDQPRLRVDKTRALRAELAVNAKRGACSLEPRLPAQRARPEGVARRG